MGNKKEHTEREAAGEEIRSAAQFPLENPSPVLRVRRDGTILFSNRSADHVFSRWGTDLCKNVPDSLFQYVEDALADGGTRECDLNIGERCISFSVVPFPARNYVNLYGRDVTKRKQAEEEARRAKEEWELTFNSVPDLIAILDNEHRILRVNQALAQRLVHKHEEYVGRHCYEVIHGTSAPPGSCPHSRTMEDGREHFAELHMESLGGDFLVTTTPLLDKAGERIGSAHIARDITERKRMEEALRKNEERVRTLIENLPGAAYRCGIKAPWRISFMSEGVESLTGRPASAFLRPDGLTWGDLVLPEDMAGVEMAVDAGVANRAPYEMEYRILHADGSIRWVFEQGRAVYDAKGRPSCLDGVIVNITDRKLAQEALRKAHDELEARVEERTAELREKDRILLLQSRQAAMGEMIGNIAHQWRQPLNTLSLLIGTLPALQETGELTPESIAYVDEKSMGLIQHMSQTINDFRNYFKPDKESVPFHAAEAVARTVTLIEDSFGSREVGIEIVTGEDAVINGYPNEFSQALLNILINARDAFSERKIDNPKVVINMTTENGKTVVTVTDNAGGIPEEIIDKIFDPYFTTKGPEHGTGVGLFMSKGIIEKNMGGRLTARNTGDGAEFRIEV